MVKAILLLAVLIVPAFGQTVPPPIVQGQFLGQNETDPSLSIGNEADSALNVETSLNGTALLKRFGYTRTSSLTVSTSPATGVYAYIDPSGNKVQVVCQDHNCAKSVNNTAFAVFLSTAGGSCMPTRWQFSQISGILYGVNDCFDVPFNYNGTTLVSLSSAPPKGTIMEATKDRLVIAGLSSDPSGVYYSQSGVPTNFVVGINSADPYVDEIGAQGDRVRALKYAMGRLFVFKTNSITSCILGDQYTSKCFPVSNTVGTSDPLSVIEVPGTMEPNGLQTSGALLFRGSDLNYWQLDQTGLNVISKKINTLVGTQTSGTNQSNTQNTQAEWNAGAQFPVVVSSPVWNTASISGSIFPSSYTIATSTSYSSEVYTSTLTVPGYIALAYSTFNFSNGNFELGNLNNWTQTGTWTIYGPNVETPACLAGQSVYNAALGASGIGTSGFTYNFYVLDSSSNIIKSCAIVTNNCPSTGPCTLKSSTCDIVGNSVSANIDGNYGMNTAGYIGKINIEFSDGAGDTLIGVSSVAGQTASVHVTSYYSGTAGRQQTGIVGCSPANYLSSGTFISSEYDSSFSTPTWGPFSSTFTISTQTEEGIAFYTQASTSPNNDLYSSLTATSDTVIIGSSQREFIRYLSKFSTQVSSKTPTILSVSMQAATTGQYSTQCIQPGSGITSWGILSCNQTLAGNGSEIFYATSAASCAALPTGAPTTWQTSVTNNSTLAISTNAAVYIGFKSLLTSATDQAQINACSLYWAQGTPASASWGAYDPVKNAAYWTTAINNSATSNRVLKYDMNLSEWYPMGLNATALYRDQNRNAIFFGDSAAGNWNQYGSVTSDNGAAINAYWQGRDIGSPAGPFYDNSYNRISIAAKNQVTGSMNLTYNLSNATSNTYTVSLSTTAGIVYLHGNYNVLKASWFQFINVTLGNNSTTPFEVDALGLDMSSAGWKPQNP